MPAQMIQPGATLGTVVAEKLAVAVDFGKDNTRFRDSYDL
jgi:hypothetical protein